VSGHNCERFHSQLIILDCELTETHDVTAQAEMPVHEFLEKC